MRPAHTSLLWADGNSEVSTAVRGGAKGSIPFLTRDKSTNVGEPYKGRRITAPKPERAGSDGDECPAHNLPLPMVGGEIPPA